MLFIALAMMLGHNLIPHHHHDFDHSSLEHHHADDHHHGDKGDENSENKNYAIEHLFSNFQHGENGVTFLSSLDAAKSGSKHQFSLVAELPKAFVFQLTTELVRLNSPPYKSFYPNSLFLLPTGLRAPPAFIA